MNYRGSRFTNAARVHTGFRSALVRVNNYAWQCNIKVIKTNEQSPWLLRLGANQYNFFFKFGQCSLFVNSHLVFSVIKSVDLFGMDKCDRGSWRNSMNNEVYRAGHHSLHLPSSSSFPLPRVLLESREPARKLATQCTSWLAFSRRLKSNRVSGKQTSPSETPLYRRPQHQTISSVTRLTSTPSKTECVVTAGV